MILVNIALMGLLAPPLIASGGHAHGTEKVHLSK